VPTKTSTTEAAPAPELDRYVPRAAFELFAEGERWTSVDGTLAFIDISGFTALSERLAQRGRVGAEELTDVLGLVFSQMLATAASRGGILLKFGGDALLLLFLGADHAIQAASAAVEMRAELAKAKDIPTSVGKLGLRMSQGVHSGDVLLFRIDGAHSELIVAGPTASTVTRMEGTADAGEIVVSESTKLLLGNDAVSSRKGDGWLLRWRTPRVEPFESASAKVIHHATPSMIPVALRGYLTSGTTDSEHRQASIVFAEAVGVDDLIQQQGVEAAADAISTFVRCAMDAAANEDIAFLASDVDANAFKVILASGVPATQVDEDGRALRAARAIAETACALNVKVGVNRGHVFAGAVGGEDRAAYTVMGDTVNLAARLMAASPAGEVYASPIVVDRSRSLFETNEVPPLELKGKSERVAAYSVGPEYGSRGEDFASASPFVGRKEELEQIRETLDRAAAGTGSALAVIGDTGIGKSRLVSEALNGFDATVLDFRAEAYGAANPFRAFRDPIRDLFGIERGTNAVMARKLKKTVSRTAPHLVPLTPLLAELARVEVPDTPETEAISGRFRQERLADVLIEMIESLVPGTVVVLFEDTHWADAASLRLLERLGAAAHSRRWFVVRTTRSAEESASEGLDALHLGPLPDEDITKLVHAATEAAPLRPSVVRELVDRAGGSPLFAEELLNAIRDTGDLSSLPTSLDGVVGSQIDSLDPLPRRVLRYMSVLGRSFRPSVAGDLMLTYGISLDAATRDALSDFLEEDGSDRLRFRHAVVRDAAYEGLSFKRRRDLHNRAGRLILKRFKGDESSVADILALHFHEGGDHERAWRFGLMAGKRNMERYANVEAATHFERALESGRRLATISEEDRLDALIRLGDVRERNGEFGASLNAYRRAAKLARSDDLKAATVMLRRARVRERAGQYSSALSETTRARKRIAHLDGVEADRFRSSAASFAALVRQAQQQPKLALEAAKAAAEAAEAAGDELALARAWGVMDYAYAMLGNLDEATHSERALQIYQRRGEPELEAGISNNLGVYAFWRGEWDKAVEYYQIGHDASMRVGKVIDAAIAAANLGEMLVNQGRTSEALAPLMEARRVYASSDFAEGLSFVDLQLGRLYAMESNLEKSTEFLNQSIETSTTLKLDASRIESTVYLADTTCRFGSYEEGLEVLDRVSEGVDPDYVDYYAPLIARIRGSILAAGGQTEAAVESLEEGLKLAIERGDTYEQSLATVALARVSPGSVPEVEVDAALNALRGLGVEAALGVEIG